VLVPALIDRQDEFSGNDLVGRFTNQPHREWIHRQAFQMGRHVIGYEVQKVLAAVDWFLHDGRQDEAAERPRVGVAGYGEGGLIALYAAALDPRIDAALVSGYFEPREGLWQEPIYRNVWGLLTEFGDAEIASLVAPRALVIESSRPPAIDGPPPARPGRSGAAPGRIAVPDFEHVRAEYQRARAGGRHDGRFDSSGTWPGRSDGRAGFRGGAEPTARRRWMAMRTLKPMGAAPERLPPSGSTWSPGNGVRCGRWRTIRSG
jgi:hypothetical protein